jgi:hypothetical protein
MDRSKYSSPSLPCQDQNLSTIRSRACSLNQITASNPKPSSHSVLPSRVSAKPSTILSVRSSNSLKLAYSENRNYGLNAFSSHYCTASSSHALPRPNRNRTASPSFARVQNAYVSFPPYREFGREGNIMILDQEEKELIY